MPKYSYPKVVEPGGPIYYTSEYCDCCGLPYTYLEPFKDLKNTSKDNSAKAIIAQRLKRIERGFSIYKRDEQLELYLAERRYCFEGFGSLASYLVHYYGKKRMHFLNDYPEQSTILTANSCSSCIELTTDDFMDTMSLREELQIKSDKMLSKK